MIWRAVELMAYNWVEKILIECKTVLNRQIKQPWSIQGKEEIYFDKIWHPKERKQLPFIEYPTSKTLDASFRLISVIYKLGPNVFISQKRAWRLGHMGAKRGALWTLPTEPNTDHHFMSAFLDSWVRTGMLCRDFTG